MFLVNILCGQELKVGVEFMGGPSLSEAHIVAMGPTIEYRPHHSFISISSGVAFLVYKNEYLTTFPLTLKAIIGNKFRFCPTFGGFLRGNGSKGYAAGLILDYMIKEKLFFYVKGEFNQDFWKDEVPSHHNGTQEVTKKGSSYWFGVGLKVNLF